MRRLITVLALLLAAIPMKGQTPAPKPPDPLEGAWNVSIVGAYGQTTGTTNNGFAAGVSLRLSQHIVLRTDTYIMNSPQVTIALGGGEYRFSLAHLLKPSSQYAVNAGRVEPYINVEAGTARSTVNIGTSKDLAKFAWSVGGGIDVKLSDTVYARPFDLRMIRSSLLTPNGTAVLGNYKQFEAGIGVRF